MPMFSLSENSEANAKHLASPHIKVAGKINEKSSIRIGGLIRYMKKAELYLSAAKIYGTVALLWSVPSLNIFGIIGAILSWKAYKSNSGNIALKAMFLYEAASAVSVIFVLILLFLGIMVLDGGSFFRFTLAAAIISIVGDVLYITAAVMSDKGFEELGVSGSKVSVE